MSEGQRLLLAVAGTVRSLAAEVNVHPSTLSQWQTGIVLPSDDYRARLAEAFGIPTQAWDRAPTGGHGGPADPLAQALLAVKSAAAELTEALDHALEVLP